MEQAKAAKPEQPSPGKAKVDEKGRKPKKGRMGFFVVIVLVIVAVAGGGGAAYWKFSGGGAAAGHEAAPAPEVEPGMVPFEPFLVNLADDGQTYLRVTLNVLVASEEQAKALEGKPIARTRVRSSILEVLSMQTADQLATPDGKTELKRLIAERIASLNVSIEVRDVLFSEFVVQR